MKYIAQVVIRRFCEVEFEADSDMTRQQMIDRACRAAHITAHTSHPGKGECLLDDVDVDELSKKKEG